MSSCGPTTPASIRSRTGTTRRSAAPAASASITGISRFRAASTSVSDGASEDTPMNRRHTTTALLVGFLSLTNGCKNYLDVNTNPNAPETVSANLYLSPMEHWMVTAPQYDGRFIGRYTQE